MTLMFSNSVSHIQKIIKSGYNKFMHIVIEDKTVSENISSFLELLRRAEAKREKQGAALIEKSYRAFLNRKSGKLIFADSYKDQANFISHDWKEVSIDYAYDSLSESFHAIAYESQDAREPFTFSDLAPAAVQAIKGTILVLNKLSALVKGSGSDLITKIKAICKLKMDIGSVDKEKSVLFATWHSVNRMEAEKILKGKPVGTFLFREDYFAQLLSEQLSEQFGKPVKCVTLTILEPGKKVSDFTLAHLDHSWRWYDDALFCNVKGFPTIEDLLEACFKDRAKSPLYRTDFEERIA
jgi:hypothetical protein